MKKTVAVILVLAMIFAFGVQAATPVAVRNPDPSTYDFSIAWWTDTQFIAAEYPVIGKAMGKWIADNVAAKKIGYVIHTGDMTDKGGLEYQWTNANAFMKPIVDSGVPFSVLPGNHEVTGLFYKYWGEDKFKDKPYYGESYLNNFGHYDLLTLGGVDFIFAHMGYNDSGYTNSAMDWLNSVFEKYPDRVGVLAVHNYLDRDYSYRSSGGEWDGTVIRNAAGELLYNNVVKKSPNVKLVLSGHTGGTGMITDSLDDNGDGKADRDVVQIVHNYQGGTNGGNGYLRMMYFNVKNQTVIVNTYSPHTKEYNYYKNMPQIEEFAFNFPMPVTDPDAYKVRLNNRLLIFDQPPIAESGRILVPLRVIFEAFGAEVTWEQATQSVLAVKGDTTIKLTLGSKNAYKNGELIVLDVPAKALNGRTLVPVRFISESFGAEVTWDQATKTVGITYNN